MRRAWLGNFSIARRKMRARATHEAFLRLDARPRRLTGKPVARRCKIAVDGPGDKPAATALAQAAWIEDIFGDSADLALVEAARQPPQGSELPRVSGLGGV